MKKLSADIYKIILYGVGLGSVSAFIYLVGPMIVIGGWRPFDNSIIRDSVIVTICAAMAGMGGWTFWKRKKAADALAEGVGAQEVESDEPALKERMNDALATLKKTMGGKSDYLYELPWYVIIGPPGSGKTTALVNSGLKFPLSGGAVAGIGGTRYCDWWFTEDAVLIDTAGRYTTQDSDAASDKKSWFSFLDLLKENRPRQPINGVIIAISLGDVMTTSAEELAAHAAAVRARLVELHDRLKVAFPVYAMFTKADLVAGFSEFFALLNEEQRRQVWGATFQTDDKTKNLVNDIPAEFDKIIARLNEMTTDRLQEEPAPSTRVALYGFPAQMAKLRKPVHAFLTQIFEPTRYHANATLRGFYLTSGTQEGTPIDQLIGALQRTFGAQGVQGAGHSGKGRSFFLTDLIGKVIIGEAAWVSTDRAALRRQRLLLASAYGALALLSAGAIGAWWVSYGRNRTLVDATSQAAQAYVVNAGPIAKETVVAERDYGRVLPSLHSLRHMPVGYAERQSQTPTAEGFGLSQRARLLTVSEEAYHIGLERLLRPRLIYRLEEQFEQNHANTEFLYEALKVYLMLGGERAPDRAQILSWIKRDLEDNLYPGAANLEGRQAILDHAVAMLDLQSGPLLVGVNGALVEDAQTTLARLSLSQRAYELLKAQARAGGAPDWTAAKAGGQEAALVFQNPVGDLDQAKTPGFFTYLGFHRDFLGQLPGVAEQLKAEQWVLGRIGQQQAVAQQYDTLSADLLSLYAKDFVAAWKAALDKLKMKNIVGDKPRYIALASLSAPTSPLKAMLESIRDETALTRERADLKKDDKKELEKKEAAAAPVLGQGGGSGGPPPGAAIEATFKPFHALVDGDAGKRPIEAMLSNFSDIHQSLLMQINPAQASQAGAQLITQVANLRSNANRFPPPFAAMMQQAANDLDGDLTNSRRVEMNRVLAEQVTGPCEQIVANRYPFAQSDRETPLAEFGRLFGVGGLMDAYFKNQLQPLVDTSKPDWRVRQETPLGRAIAQSSASLRSFQQAQDIRETFFAGGGVNPSMSLTVTPPPLPLPQQSPIGGAPGAPGLPGAPPPGGPAFSFGGADAAPQPQPQPPPSPSQLQYRFEVNGTPVVSQPGLSYPAVVQWPGAGGRSAIVVVNEQGRPTSIAREGQWSLFRLVQAGSPAVRGDRISASYVVGGRELSYTIAAGTSHNPFTLRALREFRCPGPL
jgi:type VI secretion system protein ImpL